MTTKPRLNTVRIERSNLTGRLGVHTSSVDNLGQDLEGKTILVRAGTWQAFAFEPVTHAEILTALQEAMAKDQDREIKRHKKIKLEILALTASGAA